MKTRNVGKKRLRRIEGYKHKLEKSRDKKKEHSPYIPIFWGMGLAVVLLFVGISMASATTYYVATDGSDSYLGNETHPWRTIQKAADTLVVGNTVYIKEGTYNEKVFPKNSGSPGNYITYTAYPGDTVTIDGTGIPVKYNHGLFDIGKSYIKVSGLRVINSEWAGIGTSYTDHSVIENCYTYNTVSHGILAHHATDIIIDGNEVEKANTGRPGETTVPGGEAITLGVVDGFEVKNNHVHHCTEKEGIDAKGGCSNGTIYKNHVHDIARIGIYADAHEGYEHDIDIYQNIVHDCNHGIIIEIEEGGTLENINVYNNILYNNTYYGIVIGRLTSNVKIINNICHGNSGNAIRISTPADHPFESLVVRNNILSGDSMMYIRLGYPHPDITIDHNLFTKTSGSYGDNKIIGDPKFINPSTADFHLQSASPAIDAGSSVGAPSDDFDANLRPYGAGYDIGAYEYVVDRPTGTISGIVKYISDLFRKIMPSTFLDNLRDMFPL